MGVPSTDLSTDQLAATAVQHIRDLIGRVGLPTRLAQFGIPENDLAKIAGLVFEIAPGLLKVNPRAVTQKDLLEILRKAY
jgi:alcohol dehydrogenase class IV